MNDVLIALGRPLTLRHRIWLATVVAGTTVLFILGPHLFSVWFGVSPVMIQAGIAAFWVYWLGWLFPMRWRWQLESGGRERAYLLAFYTDILPGVCVNFSQILRPAFSGLLAPPPVFSSPWRIALGCAIFCVGQILILLGLRAIGIAGAMFVWEYRCETPRLSTCGIYGYIRHPLFLGGVITSLGFAIVFNNTVAYALAAINLALVPPFLVAESRRCAIVFGDRYPVYKLNVPAILPRLDRLLSSVGHQKVNHQVIDSLSLANRASSHPPPMPTADADRV